MAKKRPAIAPINTKVTAKTAPAPQANPPAPSATSDKKARWSDDSEKSETMVYLFDDLMFRMEMAQARMKKDNRDIGKRKFNNSSLVNHALDMLLTDYEENGQDSEFVKRVLEGNASTKF